MKHWPREQASYKDLPSFFSVVPGDVLQTYLQVNKDVVMIVRSEMGRMTDTPELTDLIIRKEH
ncbi:hypothetical protein [Terrimonas alba]|uniref:hypothetical protein n=1 Tax=Terrimonas alba TaxID=3349636 RepID=UPI0035F37294